MIHARRALLGTGWTGPVRVEVDGGRIAAIHPGAPPAAGDAQVDVLLPAPSNLHSHAFQRAMAGLAEHREAGPDSFWTWRDTMYRVANALSPEQVEAVAALAFMEMQEAGFAAVAEFHYLHHQPGGAAYADPAELSGRIAAAAGTTGIGLTLLPVLYSYGGAGMAPLAEGQRRFGCDLDGYLGLRAAARGAISALPDDARLGMAPHSLRATSPEDLRALLAAREGGPLHIHAAEQPREVAEVLAWLGARPVAWLLDNLAVDEGWCLIHATHMTADETRRLAASGAVAGLCPITEANLGDGPFDGARFQAAGGRFGVGSDSNVRIDLAEELRTLEYSQRSRDLARNVMVGETGSVGRALVEGATRGGARALMRDAGEIAVGRLADLVALDGEGPSLGGLQEDRLLDAWVFAGGREVVTDLWSAGRHRVQGGRHVERERIVAAYRAALGRLRASL